MPPKEAIPADSNITGVNLRSEAQFQAYIHDLNVSICVENLSRKADEKQALLNEAYLLKRYRQIVRKEREKEFSKTHNCKYCLYHKEPYQCRAKEKCPIEMWRLAHIRRIGKQQQRKQTCPLDKEGNCPYGNEVGTCFGFCLKGIMEETKKVTVGDEKDSPMTGEVIVERKGG